MIYNGYFRDIKDSLYTVRITTENGNVAKKVTLSDTPLLLKWMNLMTLSIHPPNIRQVQQKLLIVIICLMFTLVRLKVQKWNFTKSLSQSGLGMQHQIFMIRDLSLFGKNIDRMSRCFIYITILSLQTNEQTGQKLLLYYSKVII